MPQAKRDMFDNRHQYEDETDGMPTDITITNIIILSYIWGIALHFVDLGFDVQIVVRYFLAGMNVEFGWTLAFILVPAFIVTAISIRMYSMDDEHGSVPDEVKRWRWLRVAALVAQLAPVLRFTDALIYALKSRQAERQKNQASQRHYYGLMLKEDSDSALLRIFEAFLEAAPQTVLQTSLLYMGHKDLTVYQAISILISLVSLGWCLASYQRSLRYAQPDKLNIDWVGSLLQTMWHFLVTCSRIISLSAMAYLYPHWLLAAMAAHVLAMTTWIQGYDRPPFCSHNKISEIAFSFALGSVYIFTYILPVEKRTRYRYAVYYNICFVQNLICAILWGLYADEGIKNTDFYIAVTVLCVVPYVFGIGFMVAYYAFFHPKVRKGVKNVDVTVSLKSVEHLGHI